MPEKRNFDPQEAGEPEAERERKAFRAMVDAAGGLSRVAQAVEEHTGVVKKWVTEWYNGAHVPSESIKRQIFIELRHLLKEARMKVATAKIMPVGPMQPLKPEASPIKPPVKEELKIQTPKSPKAKRPRLNYRKKQKQETEARLMQDKEYAELYKKLAEKGFVIPPESEKENQ